MKVDEEIGDKIEEEFCSCMVIRAADMQAPFFMLQVVTFQVQ